MTSSHKYICSKCGSENIELTSSLPKNNESFIFRILRALGDTMKREGPLAGRGYIVCKDCGHISLLQK